VGLAALVAAPFVVTAVALRGRHWWPTGDLAQAEMRVRSLWSHPPLIGAAGRIGTIAERGSHPGPLAYWALWPVYRLFGATPWALETSVLTLHALGAAATIAAARRVAGWVGMLGATLVVVGLIHGFGIATLIEPWNPFLPLLWFAATTALAWAVIAGDRQMWPALVATATFCVQCHVGYLAPVGALGVVALAFTVWPRRAGWWRPVTVAAGVGVVLWIPPIVDQAVHHPGNLHILLDYFRHPPEAAIGPVTGLADVLRLLNPLGGWLTSRAGLHTSVMPGLALLVVWAVAAALSWLRRARHPELFALHVTVLAAVVSTWLAVSRIFGQLFAYLVMWVWVVTATMVAATVATAIALVAEARLPARAEQLRPALVGSGVVVVVVAVTTSSWSAAFVRPPYEPYSRQMATLVPPVVRQLDRSGRYQVTFDDPISLGGDAYGLILELERRGFTAGAPPIQRVAVEAHRVLRRSQATAVLAVVSGPRIATWKAKPGARLLVQVDPRSSAQRRRYARLRARAIVELRAAGLARLVPQVDQSLWAIANDVHVPRSVIAAIGPMIAMGLPTAVLELPADAAQG
jgi:hypothetical protein